MIQDLPMTRLIRMVVMMVMGLGMMSAAPSIGWADELCPDTTQGEKGMAVNGMADLQFDIGRLNLCLQRARLLQQIDETVRKREEIRLQPLGGVGAAGAGPTDYANIPPLSAPMPLLPGDKGSPAKMAEEAAPLPPAKAILPESDATEWKIQRIWGQGNVMQAQLVKGDVIANIKKGDVLPSGETVTELSGRGVTLENGKTHNVLTWLADSKGQAQ